LNVDNDGDKKKIMTVLVECSQKFLTVIEFKDKLGNALSKYYDEIMKKGCASLEDKGTLVFCKTE
jgi:hypothetical protein